MAYGEARFEQHQENAAGVGAHAKTNFVRILLEANIELAMVGARGKTTRQPTLRPFRNVDEPAADVSRKALSAVMHAKADSRQGMLALAEAGVDNDAIGLFMGCSVYTVRRWIRRGVQTDDLADLPRSGCPAMYPEEIALKVVAFYCQTRPLPGCGRWTLT